MTIEEICASDLEGDLSTYIVSETFEVYQREIADAINHLLNHIKTILAFNYFNVSLRPEEFLVNNHPGVKSLVQTYNSEVQRDQPDAEYLLRLRAEITGLLLDECHFLLKQTAKLAVVLDQVGIEVNPTIQRIERDILQIPFVGYHSEEELVPSIIRVHEEKKQKKH